MSAIDDLAEKELKAAKLPTIFSYRQAFILGWKARKAIMYAIFYGSKLSEKELLDKAIDKAIKEK